jgi:HEAT repeat protein
LSNLGGDAKTVLPVLAEMLEDDDVTVRQQTLNSLFRYRTEAVPYYIEALKDKDWNVRWMAANHLSQTGAAGKKAIPALLDLAKTDPNASVKYHAAASVTAMGEDAIPAMVELLKQKDFNVLQQVLYGLQGHKAKAKPAVPNLIEIVKGDDANTRWLAAQTLGAIGPDAKDAIDALKEATKSTDQNLKVYAEQALKQIEK